MLQAFPLDSLFGGRPTSRRRTSRSLSGATRGRRLAAERLEARTMFNADDGQVGSSTPPPAPLNPPGQAPPAVAQSPRPITININVSISININAPKNPSATPAPTGVVSPALPVGTPAEPSTGPVEGHADPYETLMDPPDWRPIAPLGIPLGTVVDYLDWLEDIYVGAGVPVGEFDMRDTVQPTHSPAQGPGSPRTPPPFRPFGPNPLHPKGVGGPWQH